jgi:hypothetical protein
MPPISRFPQTRIRPLLIANELSNDAVPMNFYTCKANETACRVESAETAVARVKKGLSEELPCLCVVVPQSVEAARKKLRAKIPPGQVTALDKGEQPGPTVWRKRLIR